VFNPLLLLLLLLRLPVFLFVFFVFFFFVFFVFFFPSVLRSRFACLASPYLGFFAHSAGDALNKPPAPGSRPVIPPTMACSSLSILSRCNEKPSDSLAASILGQRLSSARSLLHSPIAVRHKLSSPTPSRYARAKSVALVTSVLAERPAASSKSGDRSFSAITNASSDSSSKSRKEISARQWDGSAAAKNGSRRDNEDPAAEARAEGRAVNAAVYDPVKLAERYKWRPLAVSHLYFYFLIWRNKSSGLNLLIRVLKLCMNAYKWISLRFSAKNMCENI
jgi:hypothetical protein